MEATTILHIGEIEYRITEFNKDEQKLIKKLEELIKNTRIIYKDKYYFYIKDTLNNILGIINNDR